MAFDLSNYEPVEERIDRFYQDHPNGRILTEIEAERDDFKFVVFKASVFRSQDDAEPAATGFAYEVKDAGNVNRTSHIENCETSAIGRALANLNYAAKGKRPSREEMNKASGAARPSQPTPKTDAEVAPAPVGGSVESVPRASSTEPNAKASPHDSEGGDGAGGEVGSVPSLTLIQEALADKRLKPNTLTIKAMKVAAAHDAIPAEGITSATIPNLPTAVLDEIASELHLRQGELVEQAN